MKTKKEIERLGDFQLLRAFVAVVKKGTSCEIFGSDGDCLKAQEDYYLFEDVILNRLESKRIVIYEGSQIAA